MKTTDITERGLELLIASDLTGIPSDQIANRSLLWDAAPPAYGGSGYVLGNPADYDRDHALDLVKLLEFLRATQPKIIEQFALDEDNPERRKFLARLQGEITKRGTIDVLRKGIKHGPANVDLFYGTPSPGNQRAKELFDANIFSVTRQLQYSKDETQLALDLCLFINGLPIATFELKNRLTKQTVEDAVQQYKRDRNPNELLFRFGRCMAHFAMDDQEVRFCTI